MWDCHSCDPGSNPGPGALSSVRVPTTIEHITNSKENDFEIIQNSKNQGEENSHKKPITIKTPFYLKISKCEIFTTEKRN